MKVCPSCRENYPDDVEECPDDGTELIPAPEDLPENPLLRQVQQVSPDEHTAMIDIEAIDAERERRGIEAPQPEPEPEPEPERDPEATGTMNIDQLNARRKGKSAVSTAERTVEGVAVDRTIEPTMEVAPPQFDTERTQVTRRRESMERSARRKKPGGGSKRGLVIAAIIGTSLLIAAGLVGGAFYFFGAGKRAVLTVTTIPTGAKVLLDGEPIGASPLQEKVKVGSHVLELSHAGYLAFKEVIDVPVEGLPFLQPLEPDPDAPAVVADAGAGAGDDTGTKTPDGDGGTGTNAGTAKAPGDATRDAGPAATPPPSADEMVAAFVSLLAEKKLDEAFDALKVFVRAHPDDKRGDLLFDQLAEARMKTAGRPASGGTSTPPKDKKRRAREAYTEGELLYRDGNAAEAKLRFQTALQLDPRLSSPHRALARIYQREDNVERARYHLERYLVLGGADPDYKVRRWLEEHPRQ